MNRLTLLAALTLGAAYAQTTPTQTTPSQTTASPLPSAAGRLGLRGPMTGQVRGLWVDAFGPGLKTPEQISKLVADARAMNVNVLFAQIGRRGDCYCNNAAMPRTEDPEVPAGFDPLADLLQKAHAQGIGVHAWIITTAIHNRADAPKDPRHVFNTHGPGKTGRDFWLMVRRDGAVRGGADFYLDPGHPDAAEYIKDMYLSVVRNYDVDGVQFDRVRYPDQNEPAGVPTWGYNPTALERYRAETGATGTPEPTDPRWMAWRRDQVTNLVRRTYLEIKAVKPDVSVNAATITYGEGPRDFAAWRKTRTYGEVLQDWVRWQREGWLDLNVMMNYKRDFVPAQALWFDQWNTFGVRSRAARGVVSGAAIYLNDQASSVSQARKSLAAGLDGWAGYSYRTPDADVNAAKRKFEEVVPELSAKLTAAGAPFAAGAAWSRPASATLRAVMGRVEAASGPLGGRVVELVVNGRPVSRTTTDGGGYYGFSYPPLGSFEVRVGGASVRAEAEFARVTTLPVLRVP